MAMLDSGWGRLVRPWKCAVWAGKYDIDLPLWAVCGLTFLSSLDTPRRSLLWKCIIWCIVMPHSWLFCCADVWR